MTVSQRREDILTLKIFLVYILGLWFINPILRAILTSYQIVEESDYIEFEYISVAFSGAVSLILAAVITRKGLHRSRFEISTSGSQRAFGLALVAGMLLHAILRAGNSIYAMVHAVSAPSSRGHLELLREFSNRVGYGAFPSLEWAGLAVATLLHSIVISPLVEELVFSGALRNRLRLRMSGPLTVVLVASIFSLLHYPVMSRVDHGSLYSLGAVTGIIGYWIYGCVLIMIRNLMGSVWWSVLAHGMHNLVADLDFLVLLGYFALQ